MELLFKESLEHNFNLYNRDHVVKNDTLERFAYLETQLYWGGGITAGELAQAFGLVRQTAQGVIDHYRRLHPESIEFCSSKKRHLARPGFEPRYIHKGASEFLDYLRGEAMVAHYRDTEEWSALPFHDVDRLLRSRLRRPPIAVVLSALRAQRAVVIEYQSRFRILTRDFSPNHLIFAGNRYHVRGYCHFTQKFLDFVLSRIVHAEASPTEWISPDDDAEWNRMVNLCFKPNPQLPEEARQALGWDHPLDTEGCWVISCRQALAYYLKRELLSPDNQYGCPRWIECP